MSKKVYQSPSVTDLGSVEEVTLGRGGRRRRRRAMRRRRRRNWWNTGS